jgi:NAD(P)-dependent dehydrogenase (short-subunit alcohol dehydrogenase family)
VLGGIADPTEARGLFAGAGRAHAEAMTITLITGGNRGLGLETARRLLALGHTVYIGSRDLAAGTAVAESIGARAVPLDTTSDSSVTDAAAVIRAREGVLDVLVNNAGISGPFAEPLDITGADAMAVFDVNVAGIVRMVHGFAPLLAGSAHPRIVNVSSGLGSIAAVRDETRVESTLNTLIYSASKSAVVMLTVQYSRALPGVLVNAADPGYTATDFNHHNGTQTVTEGTDAIVRLATLDDDGPTGAYIDRAGVAAW